MGAGLLEMGAELLEMGAELMDCVFLGSAGARVGRDGRGLGGRSVVGMVMRRQLSRLDWIELMGNRDLESIESIMTYRERAGEDGRRPVTQPGSSGHDGKPGIPAESDR